MELLVAILNPSWQREDRKGGVQRSKNQVCKQFSSTHTVLTERVFPLSQINIVKAKEQKREKAQLSLYKYNMVDFHSIFFLWMDAANLQQNQAIN